MSRLGVQVICRPELVAGFRLAGVAPLEAVHAAEAAVLLRSAAAHRDTGVILVQDDLLAGAPAHPPGALPMVVPFPGPKSLESMESPAAYVAEILRRAIGYRVRLE